MAKTTFPISDLTKNHVLTFSDHDALAEDTCWRRSSLNLLSKAGHYRLAVEKNRKRRTFTPMRAGKFRTGLADKEIHVVLITGERGFTTETVNVQKQ